MASHMQQLSCPILFLVFNRPDTTQQVFEAIRQARPPRLYIAADGPRPERLGEAEKVQAVRDYVVTHIDWPCEVKTLFRDTNLGCRLAVSTAIDWFFDNEPEGIILEDDCLPSQSFFLFCQKLLDRYRNDERIMLISGYNAQEHWKVDNEDYFFSNFGGIWGWASWHRAWQHFDVEMKDLDRLQKKKTLRHLLGKKLGKTREKQFENVVVKQIDTWAYPWALARHKNSGMAVVPVKSLVQNIGFGDDATHTTGIPKSPVMHHEIEFPLKENRIIVADADYDVLFHPEQSLIRYVLSLMKRFLKRIIGHV